MAFPFTHECVVEVPIEADIHETVLLLNLIKSSLKNVKGQNIRNYNNQITFNGGVFRAVPTWNLLSSIIRGIILIENDNNIIRIKYCLKFTESLILATLAVLVLFCPAIWEISSINVVTKATSLILIWYFIFGGNYFMTTIRFRSFIEEIIKALDR